MNIEDKYKDRVLENYKTKLAFLDNACLMDKISEFVVKKKLSKLTVTDSKKKKDFTYSWNKNNTRSVIQMKNNGKPICIITTKLFLSQYALKRKSGPIGVLNHQKSRWKQRYYGKFLTTDASRVELYIKCENNITYIFADDPHKKGHLIAKCTKAFSKKIPGFKDPSYHFQIAPNVDPEFMITLFWTAMEGNNLIAKTKSCF